MKRRPTSITIIILIILGLSAPTLQAAFIDNSPSEAVVALRTWLTSGFAQFEERPEQINALVRLYEARQFQPIWMGSDGLLPQGAALLKTLNGAWDRSLPDLNAYAHHLELILMDGMRSMLLGDAFPLEALLQAEVGMSQVAIYFASLHRIAQLALDGKNSKVGLSHLQPITANLSKALPGDIWDAFLLAICPPHKPYQALAKGLDRYTTIQRLGGWPDIAQGDKLSAGMRDPRVPVLRKRLVISGDMGLAQLSVDEIFDEALAAGVRQFQRRHGLNVDGVVGPKTFGELHVSVRSRITQIKLNMARWHNMPAQLGHRYLLVNIPGYRLDMVQDHHVVQSMRAIVGKNERPTPVMSSMLTYLEINPFWNIPQKIARKDILPKIHNDPQFLLRQKIQVFDSWKKDAPTLDPLSIAWQKYSEAYFPFRLRQAPAPANALGQLKFMFPNRFSVYIHDTPAKSLFNRTDRNFSSGCVRIEKPMGLAAYLLDGQHWDRQKIAAKMQSRRREVVVLKNPIAVHLVYLTAWGDENESVYFYKDVYGRDPQFRSALRSAGRRMPNLMRDMIAQTYNLDNENGATSTTQHAPKKRSDTKAS